MSESRGEKEAKADQFDHGKRVRCVGKPSRVCKQGLTTAWKGKGCHMQVVPKTDP